VRRPALKEIGTRTVLFWLHGIKGQERAYVDWVLGQCTANDAPEILATPTLERLAAALSTPLQVEQHPGMALETDSQVGQKPVIPDAALTPYGHDARDWADLLAVRPAEVRAFLGKQSAPRRAGVACPVVGGGFAGARGCQPRRSYRRAECRFGAVLANVAPRGAAAASSCARPIRRFY